MADLPLNYDYAREVLLLASPGLRLDGFSPSQVIREAEAVIAYSLSSTPRQERVDSVPDRCKSCGCGVDQSQRIDSSGYQPSCPYCVRKHLASARAWISESNRYPERAFEAEGELSLAAQECGRSWPLVADRIEQARIGISNEDLLPTQEDFYGWLTDIGMLARDLRFRGEGNDYPCNYEPNAGGEFSSAGGFSDI